MGGLVLSFRVICHSSQAHGTTRALPFSQHPSGARHSPSFLRRLKSHPIPDLQACLSASSSPPSNPNIHPTYWCLVISVLGVAQGSAFFFHFWVKTGILKLVSCTSSTSEVQGYISPSNFLLKEYFKFLLFTVQSIWIYLSMMWDNDIVFHINQQLAGNLWKI